MADIFSGPKRAGLGFSDWMWFSLRKGAKISAAMLNHMEAIMSNTLQPIELTDSDLDAVSGGLNSNANFHASQVAIGTGRIKTGNIIIIKSTIIAEDGVVVDTGSNNTGNIIK
jgi:hypothetical protein